MNVEHCPRAAAIAERKAWLEERRRGLGGTDIAVLFGVHPWVSPYSLWLDKTGQLPDDDDENIRLEVGKELEPMTRRLYTRETGRVIRPGGDVTIADSQVPWLRGSLDGHLDPDENAPGKGDGVYEGKTAMVFVAGAWDKGAIPLYVQIQMQTYMAVADYQWGSAGCLVLGSQRPIITRDMARNESFISAVREKANSWWEKHIIKGDPPPVDGTKATSAALKALYPEDTGQVAKLTAEAIKAWEEMESCKAIIKETTRDLERHKNIVREELGDASYGLLPDGTGISYKTNSRASYTVKEGRSRTMRGASKKVIGKALDEAPARAEQQETKLMRDLKASLVEHD